MSNADDLSLNLQGASICPEYFFVTFALQRVGTHSIYSLEGGG